MSSKLTVYRNMCRMIDGIRNNHMVSGRVVADGVDCHIELELTPDELAAILHQRANRMHFELKSGE